MLKKVILIILSILNLESLYAHTDARFHCDDIMTVLGFDASTNWEWAKFISTDMIDEVDFHKVLNQKYPGLKIAGSKQHRLLFHWAYYAEPWNKDLENKIRKYCRDYQQDTIKTINSIKKDLIEEQRRRNRLIENKTESFFGLNHGGSDARYSRFLASMAYNVHILGDYMSDNTILDGLYPLGSLCRQLINEFNNLDKVEAKSIVKELTKFRNRAEKIQPIINQGNNKDSLQATADELMAYLKITVPSFINIARGGAYKRRLEAKGFKFKE